MSEQLFYSREQAAEMAGVKVDTISAAVHSRKLRAKRTSTDKDGRPSGKYLISREALLAWFEQLEDA